MSNYMRNLSKYFTRHALKFRIRFIIYERCSFGFLFMNDVALDSPSWPTLNKSLYEKI